MPVPLTAFADLEITDEEAFTRLPLYQRLRAALIDDGVCFHVAEGAIAHGDAARVLNLAYWDPAADAEVLCDASLSADQLAHNAWHRIAYEKLGAAASSPAGLLLAESIASASDIYWVGRLIGHVEASDFLETQVPAMTDAAFAAGFEEADVERLFSEAAQDPPRAFEALRQLLFDTSMRLFGAGSLADASRGLSEAAEHQMGPLLHHYELSTWVLFNRAYADTSAPDEEARRVDAELRGAPDPMRWLNDMWLS